MHRIFVIIIVFSFIVFSNCQNADNEAVSNGIESGNCGSSDYFIYATLWYQSSAEMRASYYQAFNLAKIALKNNLSEYEGKKPPAIVLDLDETILDNSYYQADLIFNEDTYSLETWKQWTDLECAQALPGAVDFLKYAVSTGVEIFYVSNRRLSEIESTFSNIRKLGFPEIPIENYIFRADESSKIIRRDIVRENYEIILLLGDNLNDFAGIFEDRTVNNGFDAVDNNKELFGTKYIVFPNPMYGEWEGAIYENKELTPQQNRLKTLKGINYICK